ncbi:MAG: hypothetical protein AAF197_10740, partial [Pseudomonadota bacterium]
AFIDFDSDTSKSYINPNRFGFYLIAKDERYQCLRNQIYSHVFYNSARFRQTLSARMENLFKNELSQPKLRTMIEKYQQIDSIVYDSKYQPLVDELDSYFEVRPDEMRRQLGELQSLTEN